MGAALLLAGCGEGSETDAETLRSPSGLPVPRWVSLKFDEVNARAGPGDDHRLLWTYRAKGLPVQVINETREWRQVCDPSGGEAWIHKRTTDGRRTVLARGKAEVPLRSGPRDSAGQEAVLAGGAVASLDRCKDGWCRVEAEDVKGWAPETALWGVAEGFACKRD